MEPENETPVEGVIVDTGDSENLIVSLPSDEGAGENSVETELTRIEEIRAETTIAVAAIEADVEQARIEADTERNATWQEERAALEASLQELAAKVELLTAQLSPSIPTPQLEALEETAEEAAELALETAVEIATVEEPNLTPPFTPDLTSSTGTELSPSEEDESPVAAVAIALEVPTRGRRRAI